jgi:hypothetical protein
MLVALEANRNIAKPLDCFRRAQSIKWITASTSSRPLAYEVDSTFNTEVIMDMSSVFYPGIPDSDALELCKEISMVYQLTLSCVWVIEHPFASPMLCH